MRRSRLLALAILTLALPFAVALTPGSQTTDQEARAQARLVPELQSYLEKPSVETSASYDSSTDTWRVTLIEEESGSVVAERWVDVEVEEQAIAKRKLVRLEDRPAHRGPVH